MVFLGLIRDDDQLFHPFGQQTLHDLQHAVALGTLAHTLPAGHGHGIVVQQLVGDVDARRNALANSQQAAVKVGAITQIGKYVVVFGERRLPHPGHAFPTHLREGAGGAVHPHRHVVAANARHRTAAFGHTGAGVVRAAAAKPGGAFCAGRTGLGLLLLTGIQQGQMLVDARLHILGHAQLGQALGNGAGNQCRRQIGVGTQQPVAACMEGAAPLIAGTVLKLAHHGGAHIVAPVVQLFLDLVFNDLALFLHHQNFLQPARKFARDGGFERPHHIHLVYTDANTLAGGVIQPQIHQGLARVVVGLAAGHDAKAILRALHHVVVQLVGTHIRQGGIPLVVHQAGFLLQRCIGPTNVQPTGWHRKVFGQHDADAVGVHPDAAGGFHHLLNRFHARPQPAKAAHGKGVQAHVQNFLHAGRKKHRRAARFEDVVALVGRRRGFADVVITRQRNHPAMLRGARHIGVLEHVRAAVDPRPLAIPDAKHTIELLGLGVQIQLLRAPQRGGRQLLIHPGLKHDVLRFQMFFGGPQRLVIAAQGRATVAADKACRVQPLLGITQALQHGQAHQRLHTAHEGAAALQGVFVIQRDVFQRLAHGIVQWGVHRCLLVYAPCVWLVALYVGDDLNQV